MDNFHVIIWVALAILFLLIEANTVAMMSAWFCLGALAAMVVALLNGPLSLQIVVFVVASALSLVAFRPLAKKYFNGRVQKTNLDAVIGSVGTVMEDIDNIQSVGRVKLGGMEWAARSTSGNPIPQGVVIKVDRIEGVKVFVTPAEETANTK